MRDLTALIVSFYRYEYLEKCVSSLRENYPDINILIGNNGPEDKRKEELAEKYNAKYIQLPFDCGITGGRNKLVKEIDTKYTLVGDDDFFYTPETNLEGMYEVIKEYPEYDLIGGRILENGKLRDYQGVFDFSIPKQIICNKLKYDSDSPIPQPCDVVFNFFIAKTDTLKAVQWDEQIKVAYEHSAYFIDYVKAGNKVAFYAKAVVIHKPPIIIQDRGEYDQYKYFRMRKTDKQRFFERFGIDYFTDMDGVKDHLGWNYWDKKPVIRGVENVDFCITTMLRPKALERLLFSIQKYYPEANILIGDQSFDPEYYKGLWPLLNFHKKPSAVKLPPDCGLSYARNYLTGLSRRKYKLILEDDFIFTEKTDIRKLVQIAEHTGMITGGAMFQGGAIRHFEHKFLKADETLYHIPDDNNWQEHEGIKYKETGCLLNFMLVTGEKWDENIKIMGEHTDFFLRYPKAIYVPDVVIDHKPETNDDYKKVRNRNEFCIKMMKKHGVKNIVYLSGLCMEIRGNSVATGRARPYLLDRLKKVCQSQTKGTQRGGQKR